MEAQIKTGKKRILVLDILTGIATLLVVSGHHRFLEAHAVWYDTYGSIVYSFHMALFMFISGFLVRHSYPLAKINYWKYLGRKLNKFLPGYFCVGIIASMVSAKSLTEFFEYLLLLLYDPISGSIQIIWYIYVLLLFYALTPFIIKQPQRNFFFLLLISLFLSIISSKMNSLLCIRPAANLFFFFLLGFLFHQYYDILKQIKLLYLFFISLPFCCFLILFAYNQSPPFDFIGWRTISSILSLPFFLWLGFSLKRLNLKSCYIFRILSKHTFSIYLWQMFIINTIWLIYNRLPINFTLTSNYVLLYLISSTALTLLGGVLLDLMYKYGIKWFQHLTQKTQ